MARGKDRRLRRQYRYDALNQLVEVTDDQSTVHFDYDALGRRVRKRTAHGQTDFLWLGDTLLSEVQSSDAKEAKTHKTYLFEPGTFKPLALVQNGELYHYHLDHLGTPQEISGPNGRIAWAASFKAYGNLAVVHQNEIENNLRFQGQYYDAETGLHYNRFRYYDPACGRFINQDPIGLLGGSNNYRYVPNPTGWVDPFGLSCKEDIPNSTRHGPMNPGPLDDQTAATFRSSSYTATTTSEPTTLYRVYGGSAGKLGRYWTRTEPSGPLQSQLDSALAPQWGNTAENVVSIKVPAGTTIYEGAAAPQSTGVGQIMGGGSQVYIPRVDPSWIQ